MNKSLRLEDSNAQQPSSVQANLQFFNRILHWLIGLFQLTEKEQDDAGIHLGDPYSDDKEKT